MYIYIYVYIYIYIYIYIYAPKHLQCSNISGSQSSVPPDAVHIPIEGIVFVDIELGKVRSIKLT